MKDVITYRRILLFLNERGIRYFTCFVLNGGPYISSTIFKKLVLIIHISRDFFDLSTSTSKLYSFMVLFKDKYGLTMWSPYCQIYADELEGIQRRFFEYRESVTGSVYSAIGFLNETLLNRITCNSLYRAFQQKLDPL